MSSAIIVLETQAPPTPPFPPFCETGDIKKVVVLNAETNGRELNYIWWYKEKEQGVIENLRNFASDLGRSEIFGMGGHRAWSGLQQGLKFWK